MLGLALAAVTLSAPAILAPNVFAQAISVNGGAIQGTITDSSGASVSGAQLTIASPETGYKKDLTTDKSGFYSVGPLNPGHYSVTINAPGFQQLTVATVIRTGTATPGSFKLSVGASSTEVTVSAGDVQVNTDQGGVSDVITKQQIDTLPINGRNFLDLAQIEPGVILQSGESFDPTKAGYSAISVGGVSGRTTRILLDGQDITDETVGTTIFNVSQGSIEEFQLNRSTQDVSGDVTSTGQLLVATTTGTNTFHGQAFYNFQDHRALFALAQNGQDPQFQRNQFGGSVGGPIVKDKLFFFGNSERIKQDSSSVSPVSVGIGSLFSAIEAAHPLIGTPYRETYSVIRLDYNGPKGIHFFARANYNVNSVSSNFGEGYWLYANRDNTPGLAGGADFTTGKFTHSFRGSYEKFHNLISDQTQGNTSIYNGLPASLVGGSGLAFYYSAQHLYSGPNYLAPQGTFQSDKQFRYDGSWTKSSHNLRYGYSINRILGGGFAAFFGLSPRVSINSSSLFKGPTTANPNGLGCGAVAGAAACPGDPLQGYSARTAIIGNGQGFFTEKNGFNLAGGGVDDWREGAYIQDSWKITPSFTLNAGVRWSVDTDRANQDIALPTCGDVDVSSVGVSPCGTSAASTPLPSLWNPSFTGSHTHQSYGNFGPQLSFVYSPGSAHKTVFRSGIGIFYENDVFNNTTNARTSLIKTGAFFDDKAFCSGGGAYSVTLADGTSVNSVNGVSLTTLCNSTSLGNAAKSFVQLQQQYQANTKANALSSNGAYLGETLNADGAYATPYRTPYATQYNFGLQRELFKGAIISADYIHNGTVHIAESPDQNHIGAARYLNTAAAMNAINKTAASYTACAGAATTQAKVQCAISQGAQLGDFAGNGLDSGNQYLSGNTSYYQNGVAPAQGAAFAGQNALLGLGNFLVPIGRSGYDALQVVFHQSASHPAPGIAAANVQISYSLSRIVGTAGNGGTGGADQFFSNTPADNDNPNQFIGRTGLDHKHEVTFGSVFTLKYGPRVGLIGHFFSAPPTTLTLDSSNPTGGIFTSDITGDGTIGDIAPGTAPGDYMHRIKPSNLGAYISNFNSTQAGKLTPAGQALVTAGLFTSAQLTAIGGTVQPIAQLPQTIALANPTTRAFDANFSYPIPLAKYREGLSLEPSIVFYNVANLANFGNNNLGILLNQASAGGVTNGQGGYVSGLNNYSVLNSNRNQRGSGTFDQGAARTTEFQLKLNF